MINLEIYEKADKIYIIKKSNPYLSMFLVHCFIQTWESVDESTKIFSTKY
jgi:hypothetical protein